MTLRNYPLRVLGLLLLSSLFVYCSSDDDNTTNPTDDDMGETTDDGPSAEEILAAERQVSLDILTGGDLITWKIAQAFLETATGDQIELTGNFNIRDDEFSFSGTQLIWRPGNDVNTSATTASESLADYYLGPETSTISFVEESSTELIALDGRLSITVVSEGNLTAVLESDSRFAAGDLILDLSPKTATDYVAPPATGLAFEFESDLLAPGYMGDGNGGLIGSYSDNSLFLVHRDDTQATSEGSPERILKYNLTDGTQTENLYYQSDFVTKRLNIIDNQLIAFGGQNVNTYDSDFASTPITFNHGLLLTRFGLAVQDDFAFVVGSDFTTAEPLNSAITRFNYLTNELEVLGELPVPRFHAGTELVNNKIYIFGGRNSFVNDIADSDAYIYDIETGSIDTFNLPEAAHNTYAARVENLIYVAYETRIEIGEPGTFDDNRNINFGVYNTLDGSFTVVSDNLDDTDDSSTVHAITIFNGRLYVIYGNPTEDADNVSVYSAAIL